MNRLLAAHLAAGNLNRAIGDHFVGVHVGLRAAARLPDAQRKVFVEFSFDHFVGSLFDKFRFSAGLRELRELPQMDSVPAVALTGYGRPADIERAYAEGFAEHLIKPIDIDQLLQIVRRLTGQEPSGQDSQ